MSSTKTRVRLLCWLVTVWVSVAVLLVVLGRLGCGTGLRVWPSGEDGVPLDLLQTKGKLSVPSLHWAMENRNPLTSWLYLAAGPIMTAPSGYGLFLLCRVMD